MSISDFCWTNGLQFRSYSKREKCLRAEIPDTVIQIVKMARLTALSKPGGVRGIVAGDVFGRLVVRTMVQQLRTAVSAATAPHQHALLTHAGCECIAHALQGLTEMDRRATVTLIDGMNAFDLISRGAMMSGPLQVDGGSASLPFPEYLWQDPPRRRQ